MSLVPLPQELPVFLEPYLPSPSSVTTSKPYVTLTYAQSLDSKIAAKPGTRTKISHAETKTMTHYLRTRYNGILVGAGTVLADDPKLNCRFPGDFQSPRPIIIDPSSKWTYHTSQLSLVCDRGEGLAPYILVDESVSLRQADVDTLNSQGGKIIRMKLLGGASWSYIFKTLHGLGIESLMVEGGAKIINSLLVANQREKLVDSLIITIGPVFLGRDGVDVSPESSVVLKDVKWWTGIEDSIVCGRY